jgi:hypothetical protein
VAASLCRLRSASVGVARNCPFTSGQTVKFKVNACNDAGEGPDSEVIEAKIP